MNLQGKECRVKKIWCDKHHINYHYVYFIKRDYDKHVKKFIPYVLCSVICIDCYKADLELKRNQMVAMGKVFDFNRYAYDAEIIKLYENDWRALWETNFY